MKKTDKFNKNKVIWATLPAKVQAQIRIHACKRQNEGQGYDSATNRWRLCRVTRDNCHVFFNPMTAYRVKPNPLVLIEVEGGVAYVTKCPRGVDVRIIDHDNEGHQ